MAVFKRGNVWWYEFVFSEQRIRETTKQSNKRVAEQLEAARRTQLAKGEVGIKDRDPVPTLGVFGESEFLPFVEQQKSGKPNTVTFYRSMVRNIRTSQLWSQPLDKIEPADLISYIARRQRAGLKTTSINRELATIRRIFKLAVEWNRVSQPPPKVRLLGGENRRERVITWEEEQAYLAVASPLLRDVAVLMIDCGLRPEEIYRLKLHQFRDGSIQIHTGKTGNARRSILVSSRVSVVLEARKKNSTSEWLFPASTASSHIDGSSIKKQHAAALRISGVPAFVLYSLRHTCLTRWAEAGMDLFVLKKLAGHASISTTMRYIHMSDSHVKIEMERVMKVQSPHRFPHSPASD